MELLEDIAVRKKEKESQLEEQKNGCQHGEQANYVSMDTGSFFQPSYSKNKIQMLQVNVYSVTYYLELLIK
jgi:hypothetical protein